MMPVVRFRAVVVTTMVSWLKDGVINICWGCFGSDVVRKIRAQGGFLLTGVDKMLEVNLKDQVHLVKLFFEKIKIDEEEMFFVNL